LPDVRDGLKPSQRRILVAMNDLNLGPGAARVKCAKISGQTSGDYHPHGESIVYPTLVRMAQEWNMRYLLIDKQGNFGSIAGLPPAAMRYTEARLSPFAAMMLDDLKLDTVDYLPTYDDRRTEPTVLPSKLPNLLVNGSNGIAVSMATSIPPHNLGEVCDALSLVLEQPGATIDQILQVLPGPDFPTGGIICGRGGIRKAYYTGRSTITVRARCEIEESKKGRSRIVVSEIPYQLTRDSVVERIAGLVKTDKIRGISGIKDVSDLKEPVRLLIELRNDADPNVILNQLYQFSPLQSSFSMIFLALVDGKPRELNIKQLLEEFIRHRVSVIRRRTQHLLNRARRQKHTVEGLLLALADIERIIRIIRQSRTQAEAKAGLMGVGCPAAMMERALGPDGFAVFQQERGTRDEYFLTPVQAEAILKMTLSQLVGLEQERLGEQHRALLAEIGDYLRILSDEKNIRTIIRDEIAEIRRKYADKRRTEITGDELGEVIDEDLIEEENMVVSISHRGYIKRTPVSTYRSQKRGGKGIKGARIEDEDPIEHVFAASTHDFLLFFSSSGQVYWRKVHQLPALGRESRGRAIINLLELGENERIAECRAVRDFTLPDHYLVMATRQGLIKKTPLAAYGRPRNAGIIAIKLREDDELIDVVVARKGDDLLLATSSGMAIRFSEGDARPMGRNTSGVKGVALGEGDTLVGMVVVEPDATLLTVCERGYGKRTAFGPGVLDDENDETSSSSRYRLQRRGGKGIRDIKTTARNGKVVEILPVRDDDQILIMTTGGKIQRIACSDIKVIGRNTQGVRIMSLDNDDLLAAVVKVPPGEEEEAPTTALPTDDSADFPDDVGPPDAGDEPELDEPPDDDQDPGDDGED
jgi:DNA gyrase subunit A